MQFLELIVKWGIYEYLAKGNIRLFINVYISLYEKKF